MPEAPQRRGDVISSILDGYGDVYDEEPTASPFVTSPVTLTQSRLEKALPSPRAAAEKALPDKPLPPVVSAFQLRATPTTPPRSNGDGDRERQAPSTPTSIVLPRSIERKKPKPPSLKLRVTNGSTAGSVTHSASSSIASNNSGSSFVSTPSSNAKALPDRPLPGLPPPPPARSLLRNQRSDMGNRASKTSTENEGPTALRPAPSPPTKHVKRKMVPGSSSRPTLADTISSNRGRQAKATHAVDNSAETVVYHEKSANQQSVTVPDGSRSISSKPRSESTATSMETVHINRAESDATSLTESETSLEEVPHPATPPQEQQPMLPSPSPMPEESPSRYGLRQPGAYMDTPPASENGKAKKAGHAKGKSSTSFDLFRKDSGEKSTTKISSTQAYLQTITPSPSPATLDFSHVQPPVTQSIGESINPNSAPVNTARRISDDISLERSPSSVLLPTSTKYAVTPNALRPSNTNAPYLNVLHMNCYWQHRRFLPSRTTTNPVACMLCYGGDSKDWWSCSWCALRICGSCRGGLERCPNRSIEALTELDDEIRQQYLLASEWIPA